MLEKELLEMERRNVSVIALVCRTPAEPRFNGLMEQLAPRFSFSRRDGGGSGLAQ